MKILILVSSTVLGGHVLSAFTIARYMKDAGHTVVFAGGKGKIAEIIEKEISFIDVDIPMFHGTRPTYFTWKSLRSVGAICRIIKEHKIDIIHAFDARVYITACIASIIEKKPVTCTLCGGTDPAYNLPVTNKMMVFSEEQQAKMVQKFNWNPERVDVIRTRVEIDIHAADHHEYADFFDKMQLDNNSTTIMMISSFDSTKQNSILNVIDAVQQLIENGENVQMVFIGGKGSFFEEVQERAALINIKFSKKIISLTGPVVNAYKLLKNASLVIGVGRSAFEGMIFNKPTIIVGENGFAGIVSKETVNDIAYYNFSGRNEKQNVSLEKLVQAIKRLIENEEYSNIIGKFGHDFVLNEIDVRKGIPKIEQVYKENIDGNTLWLRLVKMGSIVKIMVPIWRDNWWHTIGIPLKKILGMVKQTKIG
jgi:UDP-N-acetylglucosamine:LPS N-acetylglucosamine transferase